MSTSTSEEVQALVSRCLKHGIEISEGEAAWLLEIQRRDSRSIQEILEADSLKEK